MATDPRKRPDRNIAAAEDVTAPPPNSIESGRGQRRDRTERAAERQRSRPQSPEETTQDGGVNSIRPARSRARSGRPSAPDVAARSGKSDEPPEASSNAIPDHVRGQLVQLGNKWYLPTGELAMRDHGTRLTTRLESSEVIGLHIAVAQARGWDSIRVTGTERFRQETWRQARLAGLNVRGYRATEVEQALLVRTIVQERRNGQSFSGGRSGAESDTAHSNLASEATSPSTVPREPHVAEEARTYKGRLVDHGEARFKFDREADLSYYVKVETKSGVQEVWGKDFKRAIEDSLSKAKVGDQVTVRHVGERPVTVAARRQDGQGNWIRVEETAAVRNQWSVERQEFLAERSKLAAVVRDPTIGPKEATRQNPSLVGTYVALHAAELTAKEAYSDVEDRRRFVDMTRHALADLVEKGEPIGAVRVRQEQRRSDTPRDRAPQERGQAHTMS